LHGANDTIHPDRTARAALAPTTTSHHPCTGHHLAPPLRKSLKKTVREVVTSYLQAGKEKRVRGTWRRGREESARGRCSQPGRSKSNRSRRSCCCSKSKSNRSWSLTPPPQSYGNLQDVKKKELLGTRLTSIPQLLDREGTKSNLQDEMRCLQELLCQPYALRRCCLVPRNPI
jgi:hypothetical protein